jgi:predicted nucleic acid-binding Zn ribbon protein
MTVYRFEHCLQCGTTLVHRTGELPKQFCSKRCGISYHTTDQHRMVIAASAYDATPTGVLRRRNRGAGMFVELALVDDSLNIDARQN